MTSAEQPHRPQALVLHPGDTVAVALAPLAAGTMITVDDGGRLLAVTLLEPIDQGHKLALRAVQAGEPVHKYGQPIGLATRPIAPGQHVHVHNLAGRRGRGDLARSGETIGGRP
ncbi:MAG: UxaA family hydrolase [Chloroflexi bacterium]|nr:UxaA family hydrolase [Chloroflexota bacterium]